MALGTAGSYFGIASQNTDLIPIFKENEIKKHPNSFLKTSDLILKKLQYQHLPSQSFRLMNQIF